MKQSVDIGVLYKLYKLYKLLKQTKKLNKTAQNTSLKELSGKPTCKMNGNNVWRPSHLSHLCVRASAAINGLIVFTWLQDNADDAREALASLRQQTKTSSSFFHALQTWRKNQLKIGAQICRDTIAGWIESFCVKCYRRVQSVRQIALSPV